MSDRYLTAATITGVALLMGIAIAGLTADHGWGDDFALYILHAKNLATGMPYAQTGFINNALNPYLSTNFAPPMLPLVLAPVYAAYGLDLVSMKAVLLLFFGATLLVIYFYYVQISGRAAAAVITAAVALNPYMWKLKDSIVTEFVFMFFVWASLLALQARDRWADWRGQLLAAAVAGAMAYFATATREIGVILVPAAILYDLLRRHVGLGTAVFLATFVCGYLMQTRGFGLDLNKAYVATDVGYAKMLSGWVNVPGNLAVYAASLRHLIPGPVALTVPLMALVCALALAGIYREWTRFLPAQRSRGALGVLTGVIEGIRLQDLVAGGYLLAVCLLPMRSAPRYLVPILPVAAFYVVVGARFAIDRLVPARFAVAAAGGALAAFALYHAGYFAIRASAPPPGIHTRQSAELFRKVRAQVPKDAVVIFRKPRAMALFGERHSAVWARGADERSSWNNMAELGATHLVVPRRKSGLDAPDYLRYDRLAAPPAFLERMFANNHFTLYRILREPKPDELGTAPKWPEPSDGKSSAASGVE